MEPLEPRRSARLLAKRKREDEDDNQPAKRHKVQDSIWLYLPVELLWLIISFIPPTDNVARLACVCRQWQHRLQSDHVWSLLYARWFGGPSNSILMRDEFEIVSRIWSKHTDPLQTWFWAATAGHIQLLKYVRETNEIDINASNADSRSAFYLACKNGHRAVAEYLLALGVDIEAQRYNNATALHSAAWNGHSNIIDFLIEQRANVNATHSTGSTALHAAAFKSHLSIVERLIQAKANVNAARADGIIPLHEACWNGQIQIAQLLIDTRADVNARRDDGMTVLCATIQQGHLEIVELLLAKQARIHIPGRIQPIHVACLTGNLAIVQLLCQAGSTGREISIVEFDQGQPGAFTAYQLAERNNQTAVMQYLKETLRSFRYTGRNQFNQPILQVIA